VDFIYSLRKSIFTSVPPLRHEKKSEKFLK